MAENQDDDDDMVEEIITKLSMNLLGAFNAKIVNMKKENKENSGSSNTSSVGESNQKRSLAQGSSGSGAGGPKIRPIVSNLSLGNVKVSAKGSGNLKVSVKNVNSQMSVTVSENSKITMSENGSVITLPIFGGSIKKQQLNISPECDLISREMTDANVETSKVLDKQMVDMEKSFQEKAKFVATLKTICSHFEDTIKNAMGKESSGN